MPETAPARPTFVGDLRQALHSSDGCPDCGWQPSRADLVVMGPPTAVNLCWSPISAAVDQPDAATSPQRLFTTTTSP